MEQSNRRNDCDKRQVAIFDTTSIKRFKKLESQELKPGAESNSCLVCRDPALYQCIHCEVAQYCTLQHVRVDSIHPKVCDHLTFLNRKQELLPKREDREQQLKQTKLQKLCLASKLAEMALQLRLEDSERQAQLACRYSYKIYSGILGPSSDSSVDVLLLYISSCLRLRQNSEAETQLAEVKKHVSECSKVSFSIKAELEKTKGLLDTAKGNVVEALSHFTKEVYFAAHAWGRKHVLATGSIRRLGGAFLRMGKTSVADHLYRKTVEIWVEFLEKKVLELETLEMQARFVDVARLKSEIMELRTKVEAKDTLTAIYRDRKFAKVATMRNNLALTCYANAMFAYVSERYIQAYNFANEALLYSKRNSKASINTSIANFYKLCKRKNARDDIRPNVDVETEAEACKAV